MDTATTVHQQRLFFATGRRHGSQLEAIDGLALRPAALARYRDLSRLRYDFPIVLASYGADAGGVRSLSSIIDDVLAALAPPGVEGERLRRHVLQLEQRMRAMALAGQRARLSQAWTEAAAQLARDDDPSAEQVLAHLAEKAGLDGDLVDCDAAMPARLLEHLWQAACARKARAFHTIVERLVVRLSDILQAAFLRSEAGRQPASLQAGLGGGHRELFDFDVMSRLVGRGSAPDTLAPSRRSRIERVLETLKVQRFYPPTHRLDEHDQDAALAFRFDSCESAVRAFRERLADLTALVKAIAIAELEADGRYVEAEHDAFFDSYDASALNADELALFPDYLVVIAEGESDAPQNAGLLDALSAGLPLKVLVQTRDPIEEAAPGRGHFAFGVRSMRLANTATGLGGVYVVQASSSHLYSLKERIERGFAHNGAALFSVYAPPGGNADAIAPYIVAAAAADARAFPAFGYDPYAGNNQAARFSLEGNAQPEADWPVADLEYADADEQRVVEQVAFTLADFALCVPRYASHFARVARSHWNASLVPLDEWLALAPQRQADVVPYVLAVDPHDLLHRLVVDSRLVQSVARVRTYWHRLQEQGGIHNSHAELLLARERAKWEAEAGETRDVQQRGDAPAASAAAAPGDAGATSQEAPASARDPEDAWIETVRCSSCNECQVINNRMFKYNENQQAYIADLSAGTYRELVLAAEACQVAIIHPGKPRNPDEPGLTELLERAQPFLA